MLENHSLSCTRLWARIAVGALLLLPIQQAALANYKILLKGGKVVEAKSKPVSMEGALHFTAVDGSFQTLPVSVVDLKQTEKLNPASSRPQAVTKVLTNDDLSLKSEERRGTSGPTAVKTPEKGGQANLLRKAALSLPKSRSVERRIGGFGPSKSGIKLLRWTMKFRSLMKTPSQVRPMVSRLAMEPTPKIFSSILKTKERSWKKTSMIWKAR